MYSSSGNGIKVYFEKINSYFGQAVYDNISRPFLNQSTLFIDSLDIQEWPIYGSSRLGVYNAGFNIAYRRVRVNSTNNTETQDGSAQNMTLAFTSFGMMHGVKNYELSNHLGNVLAVISDKKIATCVSAVFQYYMADVVSATDYSPFGAPLPGRTYDAAKAAKDAYDAANTVYNEAFGSQWQCRLEQMGDA